MAFRSFITGGAGPFPVQVSVPPAQLSQIKAVLSPRQYAVAMQAAISRSLTTGRAQVARRMGNTLALRIGDIKKLITVKRPSLKVLEGSINIQRKPVSLAKYDPKQTRRGVTVKIWKNKPRQLLRGTFKITGGRSPVYERKFTAGVGSKRVARYPLRMRFGPTVEGVLRNAPGILAEETVKLREVLEKNLSSQVDRVLAGKNVDFADQAAGGE